MTSASFVGKLLRRGAALVVGGNVAVVLECFYLGLLGGCSVAGGVPNGHAARVPDLLLIHATVRTMDAHRPLAEAVAVVGNRIAAVGTTAEIKALAGPGTRVLDAHGQLVLPGFNDAHVHFLAGGFQLASVDLRDAATPEEFAERILQFAATLPAGQWITGGDWDHERWPTNALPTKDLIDAATPATPVFVSRLDGHMALANSLALKLADVTRDTPDPDGGLMVRDPKTGDPTGVLKDAAMQFVTRKIPAATLAEKLAAARAATGHAARLGVTSVTDMSAGADVGVYQELLRRGELADLVVLDQDIFTVPPTEIEAARVQLTILDGRVVYERER